MRIVSWNIQHGGGERADCIKKQLTAWQPDIVGLTEFRGTTPSKSIADFLSGNGLRHQRSTIDLAEANRNRLLLASRWPFQVDEADGILVTSGRWINAKVDAPTPLRIILMHVPNRSSGIKYDFHNAVVAALTPLSDAPAIALGDTNTGRPKIDEEGHFFHE